MPKAEQRVVDRPIMSCHLALVFEGATDHAPVHPPDLSTRGMFINTPDNLSVGSLLRLQFRLALTNLPIAVEAVVRHVVDGIGVGVEFINLSPEVEWAVEREMQAGFLDCGSIGMRRPEKKTLLSNLPRRMWNTWLHGKEGAEVR